MESNSLGSSGVCVCFIATQKWVTSEQCPFLLGWSILIGGNLPKRGSWGRCTHFCFCKSPTLFLDARVLHCFSDPLIAWTFYCSSDSLSTELQGHCIAREMSTHSPLSVYHLLYSNLIPQHPVPLASMSPNRSHQHPQHPRASPVAPFSPHLRNHGRSPPPLLRITHVLSMKTVTHS